MLCDWIRYKCWCMCDMERKEEHSHTQSWSGVWMHEIQTETRAKPWKIVVVFVVMVIIQRARRQEEGEVSPFPYLSHKVFGCSSYAIQSPCLTARSGTYWPLLLIPPLQWVLACKPQTIYAHLHTHLVPAMRTWTRYWEVRLGDWKQKIQIRTCKLCFRRRKSS